MNEVPQTELFKLKDFLEEIVKEQKARLTGAEAIVKIDRAYTGKYSKCFVDNVNDPNHILILSHYPGTVSSGFVCVVNVIYSRPQNRTKEASDAMFEAIDKYARANNCEEILGSAWKYQGARGVDSIWMEKGYDIQETTYVKVLT